MSERARSYARKFAGLLVAALSVTLLSVSTNESAGAALAGPDCGPTVLKADGTPWACTFADDFDASTLDPSKWMPQLTATSGYHSGQECFVDTPENIAVSDGELRLTLAKLKQAFTCTSPSGNYRTQYTSGMVMTYTKFTQAFGRFEFRVKFPGGTRPGLQSSLWMWPEKLDAMRWPYSGEIDIAEWYSKYPDRVIPYVHHWYDWLDRGNVTNNNCLVQDVTDWHTYTLEWTVDAIEILYHPVGELPRHGLRAVRQAVHDGDHPDDGDRHQQAERLAAAGVPGDHHGRLREGLVLGVPHATRVGALRRTRPGSARVASQASASRPIASTRTSAGWV
jgi:hypothetical protein